MLDIRLIASLAMDPMPGARSDVLAAMCNSADQGFGDAEDPPRATAEVEVVANVRSCERAELGRRQRLQPPPGAGIHVDFGPFRKGDAAAIRKYEGDGDITPAVTAGDDPR